MITSPADKRQAVSACRVATLPPHQWVQFADGFDEGTGSSVRGALCESERRRPSANKPTSGGVLGFRAQ